MSGVRAEYDAAERVVFFGQGELGTDTPAAFLTVDWDKEQAHYISREVVAFERDQGVEFETFVMDWIEQIQRACEDRRTFTRRCSFCEKTSTEVKRLIAGPKTNICNECVEFCHEILAEDVGR